MTVRDSLLAAMDWITRTMDGSDLGFIEFRRRNPDGIPFQVWKDSGTSYIHRDGVLANWDAPIAAIEVQAYAYDALMGAAQLLEWPEWRERAVGLRRRILEHLWMPGASYFAMGMDRDQRGRSRQIASIASNGALVLDTGVLDGLPDAADYVSGLVRRICSADFVTDVGIRCRPVSEDALVGFQDYHGTWAVWGKETFEIVRGLERQGLHRLARELGNRILNAVNVARADIEFLYVSPGGRVMYDYRGLDHSDGKSEQIAGTNQPEAPQAWTVTAVLALKRWYGARRRLHTLREAHEHEHWRVQLDADVLSGVNHVHAMRSWSEIEGAYEGRGNFSLNLQLGRERDRRARLTRRGTEREVVGA